MSEETSDARLSIRTVTLKCLFCSWEQKDSGPKLSKAAAENLSLDAVKAVFDAHRQGTLAQIEAHIQEHVEEMASEDNA